MDNSYEYGGVPLDASLTRVDDKVTLVLYRDGKAIVEVDMSRRGAKALAEKIIGILF